MSELLQRAWSDPGYLSKRQYQDSRNLAARRNIHRYGRNDFAAWLASCVPWPAKGEVLEIGCGAGWFWEAARDVAPATLALSLTDISSGMVDEALACVRALGRWSTVEGQAANAGALPFDDGRFDTVLAFHMLYHLPDPISGVAEIARVLRPGGVACVATNGDGHMRELFELNAAAFGESGWDTVHQRFSLENGAELLRSRFSEVQLERFPDSLRCTDPADVMAYLTSTPPGEDASPAEFERLKAVVAAAFERGGGVLEVSKSVGVFICRA